MLNLFMVVKMRYVLILFAFVIISSCSTTKFTPMYNETKSSCSVKALKKFPEILKDKQVNRFRYEKQSTGRTRCQSDLMGGVDCKTRMKRVRIPYIKIITVDLNEEKRDDYRSSCIKRTCERKYNDRYCWTPKYSRDDYHNNQ